MSDNPERPTRLYIMVDGSIYGSIPLPADVDSRNGRIEFRRDGFSNQPTSVGIGTCDPLVGTIRMKLKEWRDVNGWFTCVRAVGDSYGPGDFEAVRGFTKYDGGKP